MYRTQGVGQEAIIAVPASTSYCENLPANACVTLQSILDKAKAECDARRRKANSVRGLGRICTFSSSDRVIGTNNYSWWDPCLIASLKLCSPPPSTTTRVNDPPPSDIPTPPPPPPPTEEEEEEDSNMFMVGGILGLLVLGGVGYAVFKNRKKKGKGKKKR